MSVKIWTDNQPFTLFQTFDLTRSLDHWSGDCQLVVSEAYNNNPQIKINNLTKVELDDQFPVLCGYVENYDDHISPDSHDIGWKLRDNVQDILDSTLPGGFIESLPAEGKLYLKYKDLVKDVIDGLGISNMDIDDQKDLSFPGAGTRVTGQYGQKAADFLMDYGRLCNAILSTDGEGNVIILELGTKLKTCLIIQKDGLSNNLKDSHLKIDYSGLYGQYTFRSSEEVLNTAPDVWGHPGSSGIQNYVGTAYDSEVRSSRIFDVKLEKLGSNEACYNRAIEERNLRKGRSINYEAKVQGFSANGELWDIGKLVQVYDDEEVVYGFMLIKDVHYHQGNDGEITTMTLCPPNAYGISVTFDNGQLTITDNYTKSVASAAQLKKPPKFRSTTIKQTSGGK